MDEGAQVILPPPMEGPREVLLAGKRGFVAPEQWWWEPFVISEADAELEREHDSKRGRYSEERRALHTDFANLPVLGEGDSRDAVAQRYVEWCNRWGSPGLHAFLFAPAGVRGGQGYVHEKRTGTLVSDDEFYAEHPMADLGDTRYRERVSVDDFSREVDLLRQVLTLCEHRPDTGAAADEATERARAKLLEHLPYGRFTITESWEDEAGQKVVFGGAHGQASLVDESGRQVDRNTIRPRTRTVLRDSDGLFRDLPSYGEGVYVPPGDDVLAAWLWLHADARLAVTFDEKNKRRDTVWAFGSFMDALYHLLLEDITGGVPIRRCANDKCGQFFRPKRNSQYHDGRCRGRVDKKRQRYIEGERQRQIAQQKTDRGQPKGE